MTTLTRRTAILLLALFLSTCATAAIYAHLAFNPIAAEDQALLDRGPLK